MTVVGTSTLPLARLRVAGIHLQDGAIETTADVAVTSTGTSVVGTLQAPTIALPARSTLNIAVGDQGRFRGYEVRFFGYLDSDGSGGFSNGPDLNGPDQVVAAAPGTDGYAWLPDLAAQLARQIPETVDQFYTLTGGRHTAFVPVRVLRGGLSAGAQFGGEGVGALATRPVTISVYLTNTESARHILLCSQSLNGAGSTDVRVQVDPSAGGDLLCALAIPDCTTATVAELEAPELPLDEGQDLTRPITVQCRRSSHREALIVEEDRIQCSSRTCTCDRLTRVEAIVTSTRAKPSWWPCGDVVEFCDSSLPLYRADRNCRR